VKSIPGDSAAERGRLRWQCRRGLRELDVLLTNYLDTQYPQAPLEEQLAFRELLDSQDALIHGLCLGDEVAPTPAMRALIVRLTSRPSVDR
jgi:antitoxin CptB